MYNIQTIQIHELFKHDKLDQKLHLGLFVFLLFLRVHLLLITLTTAAAISKHYTFDNFDACWVMSNKYLPSSAAATATLFLNFVIVHYFTRYYLLPWVVLK